MLEKKYLPEQNTQKKELGLHNQNVSERKIYGPQNIEYKNDSQKTLKDYFHHRDPKKIDVFSTIDQNFDPILQRKMNNREDRPVR